MIDLTVLIPTVGTRPEMLEQVIGAIHEQFGVTQVQVLTIEGHSWGKGLNIMMPSARGQYISCCCDDTVPVAGWFEAGRAMLESGVEPCSRYLNPDGSPLKPGWDDAPHGSRVDWCRSFLLTPEMFREVGPFIDATWYTDIDYSERLRKAGWEMQSCDGFSFIHLNGERNWLTPERDAYEREQYTESHRRQGIDV